MRLADSHDDGINSSRERGMIISAIENNRGCSTIKTVLGIDSLDVKERLDAFELRAVTRGDSYKSESTKCSQTPQ